MDSTTTLVIAIVSLIIIVVIGIRDHINLTRALNRVKNNQRHECKHENWKYTRRCPDCGLRQVWDENTNSYEDVKDE